MGLPKRTEGEIKSIEIDCDNPNFKPGFTVHTTYKDDKHTALSHHAPFTLERFVKLMQRQMEGTE